MSVHRHFLTSSRSLCHTTEAITTGSFSAVPSLYLLVPCRNRGLFSYTQRDASHRKTPSRNLLVPPLAPPRLEWRFASFRQLIRYVLKLSTISFILTYRLNCDLEWSWINSSASRIWMFDGRYWPAIELKNFCIHFKSGIPSLSGDNPNFFKTPKDPIFDFIMHICHFTAPSTFCHFFSWYDEPRDGRVAQWLKLWLELMDHPTSSLSAVIV